jgi:DNA-binding MarR family transcriptional regulator
VPKLELDKRSVAGEARGAAGEPVQAGAAADEAGAARRPRPPAPVPRGFANETGYLLRRSYVYADAWVAATMPDGVPIRHYEVLQALADLGPRSQQQLAELLWVNRTIMVKLIDALERDGLVERRRNPSDRRAYALELAPAGREALVELSAAVERADDGLTAPLTQRERSRLVALLRAIALPQDAPELPEGLARHVGFLIGLAHFRAHDQVTARIRPLGMTTALYGTLGTIAALAPISQQAVAEQLGLTGPAILQTVDRLEAAGLVERRRNLADRRSYALEPTARGHAALEQTRTVIAEVLTEAESALGGESQRLELNRLLRKLLENR